MGAWDVTGAPNLHLVIETIGWLSLGLAVIGVIYTLLKPLHFDSPGLEDDLETFLAQDYPSPIQIVFGVQSPADPAIAVVNHLKARHPDIDIALVIDERRYGSNAKVCNLINMAEHAKHGVLVLSDSDIAVPRDYLSRVVGTLMQPGVGAVTCPYTGLPGGSALARGPRVAAKRPTTLAASSV